MSYQPKVYREQGGDKLIAASGGELEVQSGGTLDVQSGATFTQAGTQTNSGTLTNSGTIANTGSITNTGTIINSSDGYIRDLVTSRTTAATLPAYGSDIIGSTASGALNYTLAKPTASGMRKTIICKNSTGGLTVTCSTACKLLKTKTKLTFGANSDGASIDIFSRTSTDWSIVGYSTAWTTTVKCT